MTVSVCVQGLLAEGRIKPGQAAEVERYYNAHFNILKHQMGGMAAAELASERAIAQMEAQINRRKFLAAQTLLTRRRIMQDMGKFTGNTDGKIHPAAGAGVLAEDERAPYSSVEGRLKAVTGILQSRMDAILAEHKPDLLGRVSNRAQLADIGREAYGEDSGNAHARELAQAWLETAEYGRQRWNAAGGNTGKIERWGLPQTHDSRAVRAAGFDKWLADTLPLLERSKMIDRDTGAAFTQDALLEAMQDAFNGIRSEGWDNRTPGGVGSSVLANQRSDARFMIFKDFDSWQTYANKYGAGTVLDAMNGHIHGLAHDIAMFEVLGPNPDNTVQWLKDTLLQQAQTDRAPNSNAVDAVKPELNRIDRIWNELSGLNNSAANRKLALFFSSLRSVAVAAKLGSAMVSAVSDFGYNNTYRAFNGLRQATTLRDYFKLMKPGAIEDQKLAIRRGLIADEWSRRTAAQHRLFGEEMGVEVTRRLAEGVLRLSGLSRWTQAGRWGFGMEFLATLTEARGKALHELDPALQRAMARYGISAEDWDGIRAEATVEDRGADWMDPPSFKNQKLANKVLEMIARETDFAVPMPDLNTRAAMNAGMKKGTLMGELVRSMFLFKSFGVSVLMMQSRRMVEQGAINGARYAASLAITTTLLGAVTIGLKDIFGGKDPRTWNDKPFVNDKTGEFEFSPGFWGEAMMQGGGFGIGGDFFTGLTNREGNGAATTLAGPLAGMASDYGKIVTSKHRGRQTLKAIRGTLPGGTLWYARTAFDRMIYDQLQQAADPSYAQSTRAMERRAKQDGTQFYWKPGQSAPDRAPDLNNLFTPAGGHE